MRKYALALFSLFACGAPEVYPGEDAIGELDQSVSVRSNYGVKSSGSTKDYTCNDTWGGLCYYGAPGEDGQARVKLDTTGMTTSEAAEFSDSLDTVIDVLNAGQQSFTPGGPNWWDPPYTFVRWTGSSASARVIVKKGVTGCNDGLCMQNIDAYVDPVCTAQNPLLVESPVSLPGTHRICTHWSVTVDGADLNDVVNPASRATLRKFAIANGLLATRGTGRVSATNVWDGEDTASVLNNPVFVEIWPLSAGGACRAHYYDYTGSTISRITSCHGL